MGTRRGLAASMTLSLALHAGAVKVLTVDRATHLPSTEPISGDEPSPLIAGDTFELPAPALGDPDPEPRPTEPIEGQGTEPAGPSGDVPVPARPRHARIPAATTRAGGRPSDDPKGEGTRYGAIGERSATDLATTFARAFTQTASEDPEWQKAPLGSAGTATVRLTIDESGHITQIETSGAPSAALRSSIARTMPLVKERTFTALAKTTRIHLVARVSTGEGDDGLESGRYGIAVHSGRASFVLPIGRRIELRVE